MAKQLTATVFVNNQTLTTSFLIDLIFLQESTGGEANSLIYYFGNPLTPGLPTIFPAQETVADLVTASSNGLVAATVWQFSFNGYDSSKLPTSQLFAFPAAGFKIEDSTGDADINSKITFFDNVFFAAETQSALVTAANAGGGGGGDTIYTADGTIAGDRVVQLNGHSLEFTDQNTGTGVVIDMNTQKTTITGNGFSNNAGTNFWVNGGASGGTVEADTLIRVVIDGTPYDLVAKNQD